MDYTAALIKQACGSDRISGIILLLNTPGGSTLSVIRLEEALRSRTKPLVAVIDGLCCSGGIYVASFADKTVALNRMCEIGSVGAFCIITNFSGYYQKLGIKEHHIYPPESRFKNKGWRDVIDKGDDKYLIESELSPYALHFQNIVRQNRPNLKTGTEGILEGKVFYAYDALNNGLIDGIMNFEQAIALTQSLSEQKKALASLF
jgi:protease-4